MSDSKHFLFGIGMGCRLVARGILNAVENPKPRQYTLSSHLYSQATSLMPGGVNSPVRSFRSVHRDPVFIERGAGCHVYDVDGNAYIDFVMSYGPLLFGHAPRVVIDAIKSAAERGTSFGACTDAEVRLARQIVKMVPSVEKVRLVNSGTEATMSAIRAARGFTGRSKVIKFEGCYHGHSDGLLSRAGSGVATFDLPESAGVPASVTADTITLPYNDIDALVLALAAHPAEVACVIVEPVAANMGVVLPKDGFLAAVAQQAKSAGALLIFDEVITGFRLAGGGAQELFGVMPDLTCLGKIVGGGLPLAAYGGRSEIMDVVAPSGPVYQAGTLSGNPLAVAAGLAVLSTIEGLPNLYDELAERGEFLANSLIEAASKYDIPHTVNWIGSLVSLFFTTGPVTNYAEAKTSDTSRFERFFASALDLGLFLAPSQFEAAFVSTAHTSCDLIIASQAISQAMSEAR